MKIKVQVNSEHNMPQITDKGEWFDLFSAEEVSFLGPKINKGNNLIEYNMKLIPLGIRMELPKGFEAIVAPRSSTPKSFGIMMSNSIGIIDSSFCGPTDEWKFGAKALKNTVIPQYSKICQFKIQLSQKANIWQRLRWLFSSKIEFVRVETLTDKNRGGYGTSGTTR